MDVSSEISMREEMIMAEIKQKIISCSKGHYYDSNRYSSCPYCDSGGFSSTIDPFSEAPRQELAYREEAAGIRPTADVSESAFVPTEAPPVKNKVAEAMSKTQFVDDATSLGKALPVVGWLVAVSGFCRGTDFRIHTGYNFIGREAGDICIHGDNTISAEKDANVTYVPQTKRFYIAHELGKNVLLVNDLPVIGGSVELHNYDVITIGTTKLVFVGLCGEKFSWGDE